MTGGGEVERVVGAIRQRLPTTRGLFAVEIATNGLVTINVAPGVPMSPELQQRWQGALDQVASVIREALQVAQAVKP